MQYLKKQIKNKEEIKLVEEMFSKVFFSAPLPITFTRLYDRTLIDANPVFEKIFGYNKNDIIGKTTKDIGLWVNSDDWNNFYKIFFKNGEVNCFEVETRTIKGEIKTFLLSGNQVHLLGQDFIYAYFQDITERKKIDKLLIENDFLFKSQFSNSNLGITITSSETEFIRVNKKFCDTIGYTEEEILGRTWVEYTLVDDIDKETPLYSRILSGEQDNYEMDKRFIKKDNSIAYTRTSVSCFRNPDKSIYYLIAYILDISDRIEMENRILKRIIETEENERTRFAQELHDGLGPLLSSIKMYTQWMLKPRANFDQKDILIQIENLVNMANQSVREIAFGLSPQILKDFGITEALKSFTEKLKIRNDLSIIINSNLSRRLDETIETIVYRILSECINNSLKHSQADYIEIDINDAGKYLDIEYHDNGVGFDLNEAVDGRHGMGFYNIQNRLKSINGKVLIFSKISNGVLIKINILL